MSIRISFSKGLSESQSKLYVHGCIHDLNPSCVSHDQAYTTDKSFDYFAYFRSNLGNSPTALSSLKFLWQFSLYS